jgi:hypothetical protein
MTRIVDGFFLAFVHPRGLLLAGFGMNEAGIVRGRRDAFIRALLLDLCDVGVDLLRAGGFLEDFDLDFSPPLPLLSPQSPPPPPPPLLVLAMATVDWSDLPISVRPDPGVDCMLDDATELAPGDLFMRGGWGCCSCIEGGGNGVVLEIARQLAHNFALDSALAP